MRHLNDIHGCSEFLKHAGKKLLATTAITAVGLMSFSGNAKAKDVGEYDVWEFESFKSGNEGTITGSDTGYVQFSGDTIIGNLGQEDIGSSGHVDLQADKTVVYGVEEGPMELRGRLTSTGEVWIFDQNGVIFGDNSVTDVGSIVATTADKLDTTVSGNKTSHTFSELGDGQIVNNGTITVQDAGIAAFVAPTVKNNGVINAKLGHVVMAAGEQVTLDMYGDGLIEVAVNGELGNALLENKGEINAQGGSVIVKASVAKDVVNNVINMDGIVDAGSATMKGGKIVLSGGNNGKARVAGKVSVDGKEGQDAGTIDISGQDVEITETAEITANALGGGMAGSIWAIARRELDVEGILEAIGLDGTGFIDTSAPNVEFGEFASVLSTGKWLLDPTDVIIRDALAALIEGALAGGGDVTVQTPDSGTDQGTIALFSSIEWATDRTLKFIAHEDIFFRSGVGINATGAGNFIATSGDDIRVLAGSEGIKSNGGNIELNAGDEFTLVDGEVNANGGNIAINTVQAFFANAESIKTSGEGTIDLTQNKSDNDDVVVGEPLIQNAIDAILNTGTGRNTVTVGAGTWAESVNMDHANLTLKGANAGLLGTSALRGDETTITPNSPGISITANNNIVDGVHILGGDNGIEAISGNRNILVTNSIIEGTTGHGVAMAFGTGFQVKRSLIQDVQGNGVDISNFGRAFVGANTIRRTGGSGVKARFGEIIHVANNIIGQAGFNGDGAFADYMGADGIHLSYIFRDDDSVLNATEPEFEGFSAVAYNNTIDQTYDDGVEIAYSDSAWVEDNTISHAGFGNTVDYGGGDYYGADGVHVRGIGGRGMTAIAAAIAPAQDSLAFVDGREPSDFNAVILGNTVTTALDDGIEATSLNSAYVNGNIVDGAQNDGINVTHGRFMDVKFSQDMRAVNSIYSSYYDTFAVITGNVVRNSGTEAPVTILTSTTVPLSGYPMPYGGDGIEVNGFDEIEVGSNIVSNTVDNGLFVSGGFNGTVDVYGNVISDSDIGMHFQSGEIDLTGVTNIINRGRVGMRFSPIMIGYQSMYYDITQEVSSFDVPSVVMLDPIFSDLTLIDNDPTDIFEGTLGTTIFNGQSGNFVELDNGALFEPGEPSFYNALDSLYQGTPFGSFTPNANFPSGLPADVALYLESKFFHFNDDNTLGLFLFPVAPAIDQENVFNDPSFADGGLGGLNITLEGLPTIPGFGPVLTTAEALNNIAPAAGETSPEALNNIATAAGGEGEGDAGKSVSCWGDAAGAAGTGAPVNLGFDGTAEGLIENESGCASQQDS